MEPRVEVGSGVGDGGRGVGEEAPKVVAWDDLDELGGVDVPDLDKGGLECEDKRIR